MVFGQTEVLQSSYSNYIFACSTTKNTKMSCSLFLWDYRRWCQWFWAMVPTYYKKVFWKQSRTESFIPKPPINRREKEKLIKTVRIAILQTQLFYTSLFIFNKVPCLSPDIIRIKLFWRNNSKRCVHWQHPKHSAFEQLRQVIMYIKVNP